MKSRVYFIDIDGTLLHYPPNFKDSINTEYLEALPGASEKTIKWHCEGYQIILVTARPECLREITEKQLKNAMIVYDRLIMGIGSGERYLINDYATGTCGKAYAYNVERNIEGLSLL